MATCDGWETLPHDVSEADLRVVGSHTKLCVECYSRLLSDPAGEKLRRFL